MNRTTALLAKLKKSGIKMYLHDGELRAKGDTDTIKRATTAIKANKLAIIAYIRMVPVAADLGLDLDDLMDGYIADYRDIAGMTDSDMHMMLEDYKKHVYQ